MKTGLSIALSLLFIANTGWAESEGQDRGGGKGVLCRDKNYVEKIYLADTLDYELAGGLKQFARAEEADSVVMAVAELIEKAEPQKIYQHPFKPNQKVSKAWMLEYQLQKLDAGIDFRLPDVADDNIDPITLPSVCRQKVQLAYTNFSTGTLHENPNFLYNLTWYQRGFLNLHEAFVGLRGSPGADTTPIRKEVNFYAKLLDQKISQVSPMIRGMLLKGRKPSRNAAEEAAIKFAEDNKCHDLYFDFLRPDDGMKEKCRQALNIQEDFRERAYPIIKRMPQEMFCKVTGVSAKRSADEILKPITFKLKRVSGSGAPTPIGKRDDSVYSIDFNGKNELSRSVELWIADREGVQNVRSFKRFIFTAYFAGDLNIEIDDYNERTQLFDGSLSVVDGADKWLSYKVVCDGGLIQTGL